MNFVKCEKVENNGASDNEVNILYITKLFTIPPLLP